MSVKVHIPTPLRPFVDNQDVVELESVSTVKEVVRRLTEINGELSKYLLDEDGRIRNFVNVYLNEEDIRYLDGEDTALKSGDVLSIIPSIAGGRP